MSLVFTTLGTLSWNKPYDRSNTTHVWPNMGTKLSHIFREWGAACQGQTALGIWTRGKSTEENELSVSTPSVAQLCLTLWWLR